MKTSTKIIIGLILVVIVGFFIYKRKKAKGDINGPLAVKRFEVNKDDSSNVVTGAVDVVKNYGNGLQGITRMSMPGFTASGEYA